MPAAISHATARLPVPGLLSIDRSSLHRLETRASEAATPLIQLAAQQPETASAPAQQPEPALAPQVSVPTALQAPSQEDTTLAEPVKKHAHPTQKTIHQVSAPTSSSPLPKFTSFAEESAAGDEDDDDEDPDVPLLFPLDAVSENLPVSPNDDFRTYADLI